MSRLHRFLCSIGAHSWRLVGIAQAARWHMYIESSECSRCHKKRTMQRDQWDQMTGI